jgi:branched-chain amino acid transport system ATP-binding protein
MALLERGGLSPCGQRTGHLLHYGQQRRWKLPEHWPLRPKLLLLDEPAAGMNPRETEDLLSFVMQLRIDLISDLMLIEHNMQIVWTFPTASMCWTTASSLPTTAL